MVEAGGPRGAEDWPGAESATPLYRSDDYGLMDSWRTLAENVTKTRQFVQSSCGNWGVFLEASSF